MWNISTWSAKYLVSHHFKCQTWPGRGPNSTTFCGGGALERAFLCLLYSGRSASHNWSSSSSSGYSAGLLTSIGTNVSLSHREIGELCQVSSALSSYYCLETLLLSFVSPNTNKKHASCHRWTLHGPEEPRELYLSTRAFSFDCWSSVHSRSTRCAFSFGIRTSGFPLGSFDSDHLLIVQGFAIIIIQCAACCWASLTSVRIACIKLFNAEYNAPALCCSITVSSSGSSDAPENSYIVW